jgi:hypothetical protein
MNRDPFKLSNTGNRMPKSLTVLVATGALALVGCGETPQRASSDTDGGSVAVAVHNSGDKGGLEALCAQGVTTTSPNLSGSPETAEQVLKDDPGLEGNLHTYGASVGDYVKAIKAGKIELHLWGGDPSEPAIGLGDTVDPNESVNAKANC